MKNEATWWPGGARVGSSTDGIVISIIGLERKGTDKVTYDNTFRPSNLSKNPDFRLRILCQYEYSPVTSVSLTGISKSTVHYPNTLTIQMNGALVVNPWRVARAVAMATEGGGPVHSDVQFEDRRGVVEGADVREMLGR